MTDFSPPKATSANLCVAALALLASCLWPRLALLGAGAEMDEGSYAFISTLWRNAFILGDEPPALYGFSLYPLMLSPLAALPGMPIPWFRLADLGAALASGWMFWLVLRRESGSNWAASLLAFIFLAGLNCPEVIDSGFKNSFAPAFFLLFLAVFLSYRDFSWPGIGAVTALAVCLREPFAIFALAGFCAVMTGWGWKAALRFAAGGIICGGIIAVFLGLLHPDGLQPYLHGYAQRGLLYADEHTRGMPHFLKYGCRSLLFFGNCLLLTALAATVLRRLRGLEPHVKKRAAFWGLCAALPLLEPAAKVGFLYHFSACLPGCAMLCALSWRKLRAARPGFFQSGNPRKIGLICITGACIWSLALLPGWKQTGMTLEVLRAWTSGNWPENHVASSMTLRAAKEIRRDSRPGATLAASGFSFFLYYLSGLMPPRTGFFDPADAYKLSDLSRSFVMLGKDVDRLSRAIRANPPDIVAVGAAAGEHEPDYHVEIGKALEKTGLYHLTASLRPDPSLDYGWMGYDIYKLKKSGIWDPPQDEGRSM